MTISFAPVVAYNDEYVYVCQARKCTRFMVPWMPEAYTIEEQDRWLIAPHRLDTSFLIIRCPQHINEDPLRRTLGYNRRTREWAARMKEEDRETNDRWSPVTPYPVDPRLLWTDDGHLSVSIRGRSNMAARRTTRTA